MILITGATGTNGKEIVTRLEKLGAPVRALVRDPEKAATLFGKGVQLVRGDLGDPASLAPALAGADVAFLLTAVDQRQNEWQTNFINAARAAKTGHVVKYSGMNATLDSPSLLLRMHASTDKRLVESGLSYTLLQPNSFMQNFLGSAATIASQGAVYMPMKDARQSMVDVRDIADCAVKILTAPAAHAGKAYTFTGPESLTCNDVAGKLSAVLGKKVTYVDVPNQAAVEGMLQAGMPKWNAETVGELLQYFATGAAARGTEDVAKILGRPPITFDQFASDFKGMFARGKGRE
jgi:uncharacterized protein YbjT (DUF2867 family)